jgi:hypothetical protein
MTPKQEIIQYIMEENEFYEKVKQFLLDRGFKLDEDTLIITDGLYGVLMKGEFAGYTLASLLTLVARKEGKKIEYRA